MIQCTDYNRLLAALKMTARLQDDTAASTLLPLSWDCGYPNANRPLLSLNDKLLLLSLPLDPLKQGRGAVFARYQIVMLAAPRRSQIAAKGFRKNRLGKRIDPRTRRICLYIVSI